MVGEQGEKGRKGVCVGGTGRHARQGRRRWQGPNSQEGRGMENLPQSCPILSTMILPNLSLSILSSIIYSSVHSTHTEFLEWENQKGKEGKRIVGSMVVQAYTGNLEEERE